MESGWSSSGFALEDLYEMAAIAEQGGFDFYARLIARATQPRVKNTLKFLRDEEAAHKAYFLGQLRARGGAPRGTVTPELQAVLAREFLEPLERVYTSGDISDSGKALSFGCGLEEKSIGFYTAMRASVGSGELADLDRIIAQEEGHRKKLELIRACWGQ
jgi:rubrerythrin